MQTTEPPTSTEESYQRIAELIEEMLRELAIVDPEEPTAIQWWAPTK